MPMADIIDSMPATAFPGPAQSENGDANRQLHPRGWRKIQLAPEQFAGAWLKGNLHYDRQESFQRHTKQRSKLLVQRTNFRTKSNQVDNFYAALSD